MYPSNPSFNLCFLADYAAHYRPHTQARLEVPATRQEQIKVDSIRQNIRLGNFSTALNSIYAFQREYPDSSLHNVVMYNMRQSEEGLAKVASLKDKCVTGQFALARRIADAFVRSYPSSELVSEIELLRLQAMSPQEVLDISSFTHSYYNQKFSQALLQAEAILQSTASPCLWSIIEKQRLLILSKLEFQEVERLREFSSSGRFSFALSMANNFLRNFPNTQFRAEVESVKESAIQKIMEECNTYCKIGFFVSAERELAYLLEREPYDQRIYEEWKKVAYYAHLVRGARAAFETAKYPLARKYCLALLSLHSKAPDAREILFQIDQKFKECREPICHNNEAKLQVGIKAFREGDFERAFGIFNQLRSCSSEELSREACRLSEISQNQIRLFDEIERKFEMGETEEARAQFEDFLSEFVRCKAVFIK